MILSDDDWCFVCGPSNPIGLHTVWSLEADGMVRARFEPGRHHQGWQGVVHGGILAALLDEAMAQCLRAGGVSAVTAGISIRFRKPAPTSGTLIAEARILSQRSRTMQCEARVRSAGGEIYAEAEGTCVRGRGSPLSPLPSPDRENGHRESRSTTPP